MRKYENLDGQFVNNSKSGFIVNHKAHPRLVRKIGETTGFTRKKMPITYLGVPLYQGRKVKVLFADLIQKITARIKGWSNKFLSAGGRITLINSVLMSIPVHQIAVLHPSKGVISEIERILSNFLWGDSEYGIKYHWRRWEDLCFPVQEGGLGFRSLSHIAEAFICKLWWRFRQQSSLWALFMKQKYYLTPKSNNV